MLDRREAKWLLSFSVPYRANLFYYFLLEILALAFSLMFISFSKRSIDRAVSGEGENIHFLIGGTVVCLVFSFVCAQSATIVNEQNKASMVLNLQKDLLKELISANWASSTKHTGDLMIRLITDTQEIATAVSQTIVQCLVSLIKVIACIYFLWWMDPWLSVTLVAVTPFILFSKVYFRKLRRLQQTLKDFESHLGQTMQDNLRLRLLIRSMNQERRRWIELERNQKQIFGIKSQLIRFSSYSRGMMGSVFTICYAIAFIWGINGLEQGLISVGTMTAFLQLVMRIQSPIASIMGTLPSLVRVGSAVGRVIEMSALETVDEHECYPLKDLQEIRLSNISLHSEDKILLHDFKYQFKKGIPSVILGASGVGKSSLLRAILDLTNSYDGKISLHTSSNIYDMAPSYRCNFTFVPQGEKLFNGSILENVAFGNVEFSVNDVTHALEVACATFVFNLPEGLNTLVGEAGFGLSEGQIQRLAVARAVLQPVHVWIFDEVTSALDPETAHQLVRNLIDAGQDKIIIFVTHDLSLTRYFSQVLDMGQIVDKTKI